jgi:hypothetical protein
VTGLNSAAAWLMAAQLAGAAMMGAVLANVRPAATVIPITIDRIDSSL